MTARGRVNSSTDWDPMRDDYNNTMFDAQYQDADNSGRSERIPLDYKKLYVTSIPVGLSEQGIRSAFEKFGQVEQTFVSRDPKKRYALVQYESGPEARVAMMNLNRTEPLNLCVSFAHARSKMDKDEGREPSSNGRDRTQRDSGSYVSSGREARSRTR